MPTLPQLINGALAPFGVRIARLVPIPVQPEPPLLPPSDLPSLATLAIQRRCDVIFKSYIEPLYSQSAGGDNYRIWLSAIVDELEFWYLTIATDGGNWSDSYKERLSSGRIFQYASYVEHINSTELHVLDVGAGAISAIGDYLPGVQIHLTVTDALAPAFNAILDDCGIIPPNVVQHCDAERIVQKFGQDSFHFINASNCIDHCYDPILAIQNMVKAVKQDGVILLGHHDNVAEQENYTGLHQWNLTSEEGRLVVWNKAEKHYADEFIDEPIEVSIKRDDVNNWFTTIIKKLPSRSNRG